MGGGFLSPPGAAATVPKAASFRRNVVWHYRPGKPSGSGHAGVRRAGFQLQSGDALRIFPKGPGRITSGAGRPVADRGGLAIRHLASEAEIIGEPGTGHR